MNVEKVFFQVGAKKKREGPWRIFGVLCRLFISLLYERRSLYIIKISSDLRLDRQVILCPEWELQP